MHWKPKRRAYLFHPCLSGNQHILGFKTINITAVAWGRGSFKSRVGGTRVFGLVCLIRKITQRIKDQRVKNVYTPLLVRVLQGNRTIGYVSKMRFIIRNWFIWRLRISMICLLQAGNPGKSVGQFKGLRARSSAGRVWCSSLYNQAGWERKRVQMLSSSTFLSIQALNGLDWGGLSTLLNLPVQMLNFSGNPPRDTLRNNIYPDIWASCGPLKSTYIINHHKSVPCQCGTTILNPY